MTSSRSGKNAIFVFKYLLSLQIRAKQEGKRHFSAW